MNYELITFTAIDSYGSVHKGSVLINLIQNIDRQVSRYLGINVHVHKYKGLPDEFYSFD